METIEQKAARFRERSSRVDMLRGIAWLAAGRLWADPPFYMHPNEYRGATRFFDVTVAELDQHDAAEMVPHAQILQVACGELVVPGIEGTQRHNTETGILLGWQAMADVGLHDLAAPLQSAFTDHMETYTGNDPIERFLHAAM